MCFRVMKMNKSGSRILRTAPARGTRRWAAGVRACVRACSCGSLSSCERGLILVGVRWMGQGGVYRWSKEGCFTDDVQQPSENLNLELNMERRKQCNYPKLTTHKQQRFRSQRHGVYFWSWQSWDLKEMCLWLSLRVFRMDS